jgi:Holliday junction resolvase RusA-like endonuclease
MRGRPLLEGPLAVRVIAMMPVPASWTNRAKDAALAGLTFPAKKPDADNILKILDALNETVWEDDAQIVCALVVKKYAENPGLIVDIYKLD